MLLIAVTGLSLAMALAMSGLAVKLLRDERRRSDARVAALTGMAAGEDEFAPETASFRHTTRSVPASEARGSVATAARRAAPEARPLRAPLAARPAAAARVPAREIDLDLRPGTDVSTPAAAGLFVQPDRTSPWGARLAVAAGLAILVTASGFVLRSPGPGAVPAGSAPEARAASAAPLELLSLRHAQQDFALTVTGLVQNPRTGAALTRVIATALAFDAEGTLLASGQAPLDFTNLTPGAESPFVVRIPVTGDVARYRVGFRSEDGGVIAHVDKRTPEALARR